MILMSESCLFVCLCVCVFVCGVMIAIGKDRG